MCLITFNFHAHPNYKLILAANRDEFYKRPTAKAGFWEDHPNVLAGRDLEQMGTWMGITKGGRIASLTNYRNPKENKAGKRSRGEIVSGFLTGNESAQAFLLELQDKREQYQGFNLIVGDADSLFFYSNVQNEIIEVEPGTHGLSNHLLDTEWPKVLKGKSGLYQCIADSSEVNVHCLFSMLQNADPAADKELPETGVNLEWERSLSPLFIKTPDYGTRSSTVLTIDRENKVNFIEKTFMNGQETDERAFEFSAAGIGLFPAKSLSSQDMES